MSARTAGVAIGLRLGRLTGLISLIRNSYLVREMVRREIQSRYRGSTLGLGWALLYPLLILGSYTFVFRSIFKARWPSGEGTTSEFAMQVFAGLLVFNLFSDLLLRAPQMVLAQPNLVKKVIFPLDILAWVAAFSGIFNFLMGLLILSIAAMWLGSGISYWILATPLIVVCMMPALLGLAWLLGALGVFVRDIGHAMGAIVSMLLFVSPVLYPAKALPELLGKVLWLNPLTVPIEALRRVVLAGQAPDMLELAVYAGAGVLFAVGAKKFFEKLQPAFADEL